MMQRLFSLTLGLAVIGASAPAHAQDTARADIPRVVYVAAEKDPTLATVLSIMMTGAGQVYAGRASKGIKLWTLGLIGGIVAVGQGDAFPGLAITLGAWGAGVLSAGGDAARYNDALRARQRR